MSVLIPCVGGWIDNFMEPFRRGGGTSKDPAAFNRRHLAHYPYRREPVAYGAFRALRRSPRHQGMIACLPPACNSSSGARPASLLASILQTDPCTKIFEMETKWLQCRPCGIFIK
jgi:hypothetical protein